MTFAGFQKLLEMCMKDCAEHFTPVFKSISYCSRVPTCTPNMYMHIIEIAFILKYTLQ